jgi:heavy metal translocating P-type ATPase
MMMTALAPTILSPPQRERRDPSPFIWPGIAIVALGIGFALRLVVDQDAANLAWAAGLFICAIPIVWQTIADASRGRFATDIVATLAITGALVLDAPIAGLVVVVMKRGGDALERYAEGKASRAVHALEAAAPRIAHRLDAAGSVADVPAAEITPGDLLLVRAGELLPCDGIIEEGQSDLDTSSLTGEPMPVAIAPGARVMSGSANGSGVLRMRATARAAESQYVRIVELVRNAQSHKAPLQRMADRYAVWFTPATIAACAVAYALTHDWLRVLAVLVVATPCPLILATPVAFVGGINRAARRHIIVRNGGALEALSRVSVAVFDKTGTITLGEPRIDRVRTLGDTDERVALALAAAVEEGASHRLARTIAAEAAARGLAIPRASEIREAPGAGVEGIVNGQRVRVGGRSFVVPTPADEGALLHLETSRVALRSYIAVDGRVIAVIEFADELRADLPVVLRRLRDHSVGRVVLLSGDHDANARLMATRAGIDEVRGDLLPEDKSRIVGELRRTGATVMMVGDGTNDAPALTAADVGVALAGRHGGITAEAADVILLRDSLELVAEALQIGSRTVRIARQSILVGLALSGVAMVIAAFGGIQPVAGALLQEAIDVAVIVNALRTVGGES